MTYLQQKTIDEMQRQGLHFQLGIAEDKWQHNKKFKLAENIKVPRLLRDYINKSNQEIDRLIH